MPPSSVACPLTSSRSACASVPLSSASKVEPGAKRALPATCSVPMELPGATTPPVATVVLPTVPVPCKRPPDHTAISPPSVPFTDSMPCATEVLPVKAPESPVSSKLPAPALTRPPLPLKRPANCVERSLPPVVSVPVPTATSPAPASEPMVASKPLRSSVALPATVNALAPDRPVAEPARSVPPWTQVAPA
ncbi:hypothetical protein D9M68_600480 [compost metagenome]